MLWRSQVKWLTTSCQVPEYRAAEAISFIKLCVIVSCSPRDTHVTSVGGKHVAAKVHSDAAGGKKVLNESVENDYCFKSLQNTPSFTSSITKQRSSFAFSLASPPCFDPLPLSIPLVNSNYGVSHFLPPPPPHTPQPCPPRSQLTPRPRPSSRSMLRASLSSRARLLTRSRPPWTRPPSRVRLRT